VGFARNLLAGRQAQGRPEETAEAEDEDDYENSKRRALFPGLGTCLLAAGRQAFSARFRTGRIFAPSADVYG
jgi:hypothetical protein